MLVRDEELRWYFDNKVPLFRVHYPKRIEGDVAVCSCSRGAECSAKGKHPAETHGVNDARPRTSAAVFRDYNIGVACGRVVVVLDVDPRNGGTQKLAELEEKHGPLPRTPEVATGGGGRHLYFCVAGEQRSGNAFKSQGVELKGVGSYVLAPTSLHASGRRYEWVISPDECPLAPLPAWLVAECCEPERETTTHTPTECTADREEILSALNALDPSMGESEWWKVGAACHAAGLSFEDWDAWSAKCPEKYSREACEKKWKRYKADGGKGPATLFEMAYAAGWNPPQAQRWEFPVVQKETPAVEEPGPTQLSSFQDIDFPPGMAGSIAEEILAASVYKIKRFSISSCLSMLAGCAQGSYRSPNGAGVLGSYQFLITPVGGGKAEFVLPCDYVLSAIEERLVSGDHASGQALRMEMRRCPSRILVIDEGIKFLNKLFNNKDPNATTLQGDFLTAWSGGKIQKIVTKEEASSSPAIEKPTVSMIGAGPTDLFRALLRQGKVMVEDGFLSRLDFVIDKSEKPKTFLKQDPYNPSSQTKIRLERIAKRWEKVPTISVPQKGEKQGSLGDWLKYPDIVRVAWGDDVKSAWNDFAGHCYDKTQKSSVQFLWGRAAEKVLRTASLLAIADSPDEPTITIEHLSWAIRWQLRIVEDLSVECREYLDKSDEETARAAVLGALKKTGGKVHRSQVGAWSRAWLKFDERIRKAALESLERDGLITVRPGRYKNSVLLEFTDEGRQYNVE